MIRERPSVCDAEPSAAPAPLKGAAEAEPAENIATLPTSATIAADTFKDCMKTSIYFTAYNFEMDYRRFL